MDRDEAKEMIGKWFGEASDDVDTDRLAAMLRETRSQVDSGVGCPHTYNKFIQALEVEIEARRHGRNRQKARERTQP